MNLLKELFESEKTKKFFSIVLLVVLLVSLKSMFNLLLLTFIFTFIFSTLQEAIYKRVIKVIPIKKEVITISLYLSALAGIIIALLKYIPLLIKQLVTIGGQISEFRIEEYAKDIHPALLSLVTDTKIDEYIGSMTKAFVESVPHIGGFSLHLFLALMLSFFFILEKEKIIFFGKQLENSKVGSIYIYYKEFGKSFLNSFGKVLNVQIMISFINAILSVVMLAILGFSQVVGLGFMIFILGLIPVAGVVVSFIPISIIAFSIGGMTKVLWVIVIIIVLHALESYVLNPKLMSMKTELPIFLTFVVLIVGEHFLGIWGLLVGLPIFMFLLDIFKISPDNDKENIKKRIP